MLVLSNRISFVLAATFACLAHGAEFPTALEGEVVSQKDGWRNTVAVRGLSFTEGRLAGRGDLSVKPPTHANKRCMRIDTARNQRNVQSGRQWQHRFNGGGIPLASRPPV